MKVSSPFTPFIRLTLSSPTSFRTLDHKIKPANFNTRNSLGSFLMAMGDHHKSSTGDLYSILLPKSFYKALFTKFHHGKSPKGKGEEEGKYKRIDEACKSHKKKKKKKKFGRSKRSDTDDTSMTGETSEEDDLFSHPSLLSRTMSRRSHTPTPQPTYLSKSSSRRTPKRSLSRGISRTFSRKSAELEKVGDFSKKSEVNSPSISRSMSSRNTPFYSGPLPRTNSQMESPSMKGNSSKRSTTPIMFSQSTAQRKPPPVEKKLQCTLEELCHGGLQKITITRDVMKKGFIIPEEETLQINIKPGWRKGTQVTFEGKGDEQPGYLPADLIFTVEEEKHPLFRRRGDDLEIAVEIPLVKALTSCYLQVPLLGGESMNLTVDDVIYPGFEKVIKGKGMPKQEGRRGDLKITFLVNFPKELSNQQRSQVYNILKDCGFD